MTETYYFPFITEKKESNQFAFVLNELYQKLGDDLSRELFANRVMYNLTYDYRYVRRMVDLTEYGQDFSALLDYYSDRGVYIYGAADRGDKIFRLYPEKAWKGYLDRKKGGETMNGLPVYTLNSIDPAQNQSLIFISNRTRPLEIKQELIDVGFNPEQIITWNEWNRIAAQNNYFDDTVIDKHKDIDTEGAFVDGGCFNGYNTIDYLRWMQNEDLPVHAFEADERNLEQCAENLRPYRNVSLHHCGLSDHNEIIYYNSKGSSSSSLLSEGEDALQTDALDNILGSQRISFIKMDIEGYEERALKGCAKIISEQSPVLAISIYHKRDDILTIPKLILEFNDSYTFYFRHYFLGSNETVLYAVNKK